MSLPAGLTLNVSTGVISGTPTAPGTSSVTITVTDAVGATSTQNNSLTVVVGSLDQTIITAAIPPHGFGTPPILIGGGAPGTHTAYFLLEDGFRFLLEDST